MRSIFKEQKASWLDQSEQEGEWSMRNPGQRRSRLCGAFQVILRMLAFNMRESRNHLMVLNRGMTRPDLF